MINSIIVANFFVKKSLQENKVITPMKVIKLTYIAHGWYLGLVENPLLDENAEAWMYGPVVPSVYHAFKNYRKGNIDKLAPEGVYPPSQEIDRNEFTKKFLETIWEKYKEYDGTQLSELTHKPNTPWDIVWNLQNGKSRANAQIPDTIIKEHYKKLLDEQLIDI